MTQKLRKFTMGGVPGTALVGASVPKIAKQQEQQHSPETIGLICNLLELNLKLFQDLFRYKHAFNSFQADLNTHLITIANHQQQQMMDENNNKNEDHQHRLLELQRTRQKLSDLIIEKFLQTCTDLSQPEIDSGCNYESSIYSILAIVDDFNNRKIGDPDDLNDGLMMAPESEDYLDPNDSELKSLSKQIGSFLFKLNSDQKFRSKLLERLFEKMINPKELDDSGLFDKEDEDEGKDGKDLSFDYQKSSAKHIPKYQCKFCLKTFEQKSILIKHQREQHQGKYGCAKCKKTFRNEYVMRIHIRKDSCCSRLRSFLLDSSTGIKAKAKEKESTETIPVRAIFDSQYLEREKIQQQQQSQIQLIPLQQSRNHVCQWPGCGKTFTRGSYLSNHMMTHSNERNFACYWPGCSKRYKTQAHLLNHLTVHRKQQQQQSNDNHADIDPPASMAHLQCPWTHCMSSFATEQEMLEHYQQSHSLQQQQVTSKQTTNKSGNIYMTVFDCEYSGCEFSAKKLSQLNQHVSLEHGTGLLPFSCEYCGTSFRKKSSLSNHIKSHSGQFTCSWHKCSFRSNSAVVLSRHMISHKDYITTNHPANNDGDNVEHDSSESPKSTSQPQTQLKQQAEQETYTCELCSKTFNKRASIISHVRAHSGQYNCQGPGCHFASQSKMLYKKHVNSANHDLDQQQEPQGSAEIVKKPEEISDDDISAIIANHNQQSLLMMNQSNRLEEEDYDGESKMENTVVDSSLNNFNETVIEAEGAKSKRIFYCRFPGCSYSTQKRPLFRVHRLKHSDLRKHQCWWPKCGKSFKAKSTLNRHVLRHRQLALSNNRISNNSEHSEAVTAPDEDDNFGDRHSENQQEECLQPIISIDDGINVVGKNDKKQSSSSSSPSSSGNEPAAMATSRPFKCDQCGSSFGTKSALSNHSISHRKPQFRCQYPGCFYETFRSTILQRHVQDVHEKDTKMYRCSKISCQQSFNNWKDLHQHVLMHKNQPIYSCFWPGCSVGFNNRSIFQEHLESHKNRKDGPKSLNVTGPHGLLDNHEMMIKQDKKFKCSWNDCSYSSNLSSNLRKHLTRHQRQAIEEQRLQHQKQQRQRLLDQPKKEITNQMDDDDNGGGDSDQSRSETFISMPFVAKISSSS